MALIVNLIAAIILFAIPIRMYRQGDNIIANHPFNKDVLIGINFNLYFLVFSILTAMVFLGPLSLLKYVFWIGFFILLMRSGHLEYRFDSIVKSYLLFIIWAVISSLIFSSAKFQALMMLIKYVLPLFYLWLGYSAIKDSDDLLFFMKKVAIGMCIYALFIGGFSAKFLKPLYIWLNYGSGGLFISYASLADYFSSLIVIPIGLYLITNNKKWILATIWILLSTVLESVRTGLGGILLASSFLLITIFKGRAIPWIVGLSIAAIITVFAVPSIREKMFWDETKTIESLSVSDANFDNIRSNARGLIWDINMHKFYYPHKITGSGLGESVEWMKGQSGLKLIHSDYVQILCDLGIIGLILFGIFVLTTLYSILSTAWNSETPYILKLLGGMSLGSCAGTFFSMGFDNVIAYAQQSFVIPFVMIGIYLKIKDLYELGAWDLAD